MAKRLKEQTKTTVASNQLKTRIIRWLQESGLYTGPQTQPDMNFAILGRFPKQVPPPGQSLPFYILNPVEDPSQITVVANVNLAQEHRTVLQGLDETERERFVSELKIELLFRCQFNFRQDERTKEYLGIQLAETIFLDPPLTKNTLFKTVERIFLAYILISLRVQELVPSVELSQ